jgi:hypothetical protein
VWNQTADVLEWIDKIHYHQNDADFLPEGSFDMRRFKDLNSFANNDSMPDQGVTAISEFAKKGKVAGELTPFEVSERLEMAATILIRGSSEIGDQGNPELRQTLGDFRAMGYMAEYYAHKIKAATYVARFRCSGDEQDRTRAVAEAEAEVAYWTQYGDVALAQYKPQLFARTQMLDWKALTKEVERDVTIAREARKGEPVGVTASNKLWEVDKKKL